MSETKEDLQMQLNCFSEYCDTWKLKVNTSKTKVLIFSKGRQPNNINFIYEENEIEIVKEFNYLGLLLTRSGSFNKAKKRLSEKATKAMYNVIKKGRQCNLSIECQLELFDKLVKPILLYGCEVWGFGKNDIIEQVHLKFLKHLLHLKRSTPSMIVYGETGRYPLEISIKCRMITYWCRLLIDENKLSSILYKFVYSRYHTNNDDILWIKNIKNILDNAGFSNLFYVQNTDLTKWLPKSIKLRLIDQFKQIWNSAIQNTSKCITYRLFKEHFEFENYFNIINDRDIYTLCKFRTSNHSLPIEKGRWHNIDRSDRKCSICTKRDIGDEYHYIFVCPALQDERRRFIPNGLIPRHNIFTFNKLFNSKKPKTLRNLCNFIRCINSKLTPS